jgi:hypothetical protein
VSQYVIRTSEEDKKKLLALAPNRNAVAFKGVYLDASSVVPLGLNKFIIWPKKVKGKAYQNITWLSFESTALHGTNEIPTASDEALVEPTSETNEMPASVTTETTSIALPTLQKNEDIRQAMAEFQDRLSLSEDVMKMIGLLLLAEGHLRIKE